MTEPSETDEGLSLALWRDLAAALATFLRVAWRELGGKRGERCPRCWHTY